MSKVLKVVKIHVFWYVVAIQTVSAGHKLVYEGWKLFEEMCEEVGPGELVQLLCALKMSTTPTPSRTLVKFEVPKLVDVPKGAAEGGQDEEMVTVKQENQRSMKVQFTTTKWGGIQVHCGNCKISPMASKRGMESHIRSVHSKKALVCTFCYFSTYNYDSLNQHAWEHN